MSSIDPRGHKEAWDPAPRPRHGWECVRCRGEYFELDGREYKFFARCASCRSEYEVTFDNLLLPIRYNPPPTEEPMANFRGVPILCERCQYTGFEFSSDLQHPQLARCLRCDTLYEVDTHQRKLVIRKCAPGSEQVLRVPNDKGQAADTLAGLAYEGEPADYAKTVKAGLKARAEQKETRHAVTFPPDRIGLDAPLAEDHIPRPSKEFADYVDALDIYREAKRDHAKKRMLADMSRKAGHTPEAFEAFEKMGLAGYQAEKALRYYLQRTVIEA